MPAGAPTAPLTQRAARERFRCTHGHGAQSPRSWPSNQRSDRGQGGITPCPRVHLQPPSRSELHERGFGAPMGMGLSPHVLGQATSEVAANEGSSRHAHGCTYSPPHAASSTREVSVSPWAWGSVPTFLAEQPAKWPRTRGHHAMPTGAPTAPLTQRAARERFRCAHGHGAQSPRSWPSNR